MTVRDQTFRYYRFRTPDDNAVDFYDENGRSTRKFLIRKPIADGELTSRLRHALSPDPAFLAHAHRRRLGARRSARRFSPPATASSSRRDGIPATAGASRSSTANGYVTTYNHMSGFGRGIAEGVRVTQGQVVGYLGQTGLATGPHLHYEVIINGNFVDPMAIKLARTREFDGRMLGLFKKERERIDGLMAQAPGAARRRAGPDRQAQLSVDGERGRAGGRRSRAPRARRAAGKPCAAQGAQAARTARFSTVSRRRRRAPAGDGDSAAPAGPSSACNSRCSDVEGNRSRPRTTSVTPCSASSTTTAR